MAIIDDVARMAGVCRSTVSRVLHGSSLVKPNTTAAVQEAIRQLNYTPNTAARSLVSKRTYNIGVTSSYILNDPFYSIAAEVVYTCCKAMGYHTLFLIHRVEKDTVKDACDILNGTVDGYLFMGDHSVTDGQMGKILGMDVPAAMFKTGVKLDDALEADIDNLSAAILGTEHLIQLGHRRIALMYGNMGTYETNERIKGYCHALDQYGIPYEKSLMFRAANSYSVALERTKELIASGATAVFCLNDAMAHGVIRGAGMLGRLVPNDLSVLGFDDIAFNNYTSYEGISTVRQPIRDMCSYLAESLVKQIETGERSGKKMFPTELVEHGTLKAI